MSDYGRYETETRSRPRRRTRDSIFGSDRSGSERHPRYRDNQPGGWLGDGRTSDYDRRDNYRGGRSRYGRDDWNNDLPHEETSRLIASNKVEGTPVYGRDRNRLGTIYNFMVDKISGRVDYAVMRYGGFLGIGQRYFPLPWDALDYETRAGGYVVDMVERDLEDAPSFGQDNEPTFDASYGRHVYGWYGLDY